MCALGTKLLRPVVVKRVVAGLKEHPLTQSGKSFERGDGARRRGKRDAGTSSVSARTSMWWCLAIILSNEVPTFCTSTYLSIPVLSRSSAWALLPGGRIGESLSSAFSLKDMTMSNTFNSHAWVGWGEAKADSSNWGGGGSGVCVCVCLCAGGGREGLGS